VSKAPRVHQPARGRGGLAARGACAEAGPRLPWLAMSDHCAATRWYALLTPRSPAVSARRSHSMALARWSSALDGIDSSALLYPLIALTLLPAPRFRSEPGRPGSRPARDRRDREYSDLGQRPVAMKKHRINAHPARRIYRKIARIESGVRQKTFGSCDLIKEGETGAFKCLTPSTSSPARPGLFLVRRGGSLEALEASLRAFERRRRLLLDRLKER
jgi:hypothetical protein